MDTYRSAVGKKADDALLNELDRVVAELGEEEVQVLTLIARRLLTGQQCYGLMDVATDQRDFLHERGEELADAVVYTAMQELRRLKKGAQR